MSSSSNKRGRARIVLAEPIEMFGQTITEITLKEPGGGLYAQLGEPRLMIYTGAGSGYFLEKDAVVKAYIDELIDHEQGHALFILMCLEDAKATREALFDFFAAAEARLAKRKAISSSSASAA